jgi:HK97 family phage portal protein
LAFISNGAVTKSPTILERFTPASWNGWPQPGITQAFRWGSYSGIYRRQLWVSVLVNKIANATARLPLKVYERKENGRPEARDSAYAELIRNPNPELDPYLFWLWTVSTLNIYGEAFWLKVRDRGGRPVQLVPWHPTRMVDDTSTGSRQWFLQRDDGRTAINRRDFVHFRFFDPDSLHRGMSPLEPLRDTLENEHGARAANSALWRNGARPSYVLRHPGQLNTESITRLRDQWSDIHGGVGNWAKTAVLEEGMEAQALTLNSEELQYVESRKLNREEACAAYDVPPPVVHILDRATFSNITEQMRSMYRDTMAPKLKLLESTLETELRDGRFGDLRREPDFGPFVYAEFLMDEVLRGDFETRIAAMAQAIQTGQLMPSEARAMENRPFVTGSDQLFINAAVVPVDQADDITPGAGGQRSIPTATVRTLMGRLSRQETLAEVDPAALTADLNGSTQLVLSELDAAQMADLTVAQFRDRLRTLEAR